MAVRPHPASRPRHRVPRLRRTGMAVRGTVAALALSALLAGTPWALAHFIGWPLPDELPTGAEVSVALTSPLRTELLLNTLACILWALWGAFVLDVGRTAVQGLARVRELHLRTTSPLRTLTAGLVGAVLLALLSTRHPTANPPAKPAAATALLPHEPTDKPHQPTDPDRDRARPKQQDRVVTVQPPRHGIHDSLWRIAQRHLNDGHRWPEIYALNRGRPQPHGESLTHPGIIKPGWTLRLPKPCPEPGDNDREPKKPRPPDRPSQPPAPPATPPAQTPAPSPHEENQRHGPGVDLPSGAFVGLGLATAITAALLTVRHRRRIRYRPGSRHRDDIHIAPVVRALRIAHDQATTEQPATEATSASPARTTTEAPAPEAEQRGADATTATPVGVKDGRPLAWDLARSRGLGLLGPGAAAAARALILHLLAEPSTQQSIQLVVPAADLRHLLGKHITADLLPPQIRVAADLNEALTAFQAELLGRTTARAEDDDTEGPFAPVVLLATPTPDTEGQLQAILDNGSTLGLAGILLGQWRPGATLRIREDGTVAATSPTHAEAFENARLFQLPTDDAQDLLRLLAEAAPTATEPTESEEEEPLLPPDTSTAPGEQPAAEGDTPPHGGRPEAPSPADDRPLRLSAFGRVRLTYRPADTDTHMDITTALAPKHRELLAYLILRPTGVRREALAATLWPDAPTQRPYNSFHAALSQMRRSLRLVTQDAVTELIQHFETQYALDPGQLVSDVRDFQEALTAARASGAGSEVRAAALHRVVTLYEGDFAEDVSAEWAETPRESFRRDYLDAIGTLVRALSRDEPRQALLLLEQAREKDLYNEALYRDIARLQARLGQHEAIPRTLALLTRALSEVGEQPSSQTIRLCEELQVPSS